MEAILIGNNIDVYMNGKLCLDLIKENYGSTIEVGYIGNIKFAIYYLDGNPPSVYSANIKLDELFVWEKKLSSDEIYKLYDSYEWVD